MKYQNEILNEIDEVLSSVNEERVNSLISMIQTSDKIVGYGAGRMGLSLKAFIMRLNHLGIKAYYIDDTYIPPLTQYDMVLVSSGSGETSMIKHFVERVKEKTDCPVVSILGNKNSSIGKLSDWVVEFKPCNGGLNSADSDDKISSIQLMSTLNEQATYILFDIIAKKLADKLDLDTEKTKRNHFNVE